MGTVKTHCDQEALELAVGQWLAKCQALVNDYYRKHYQHVVVPILMVSRGPRYWRIARHERHGLMGRTSTQDSAFAFIDATNGDVRKPASWKTPAKHARGNVFDDKGGMGWMSASGVGYLR